jgi:hypothetical protein
MLPLILANLTAQKKRSYNPVQARLDFKCPFLRQNFF